MATSTQTNIARRLPIGAELQSQGGVHVRVWAPKRKRVEVVFESAAVDVPVPRPCMLAADEDGYFSGYSVEATAGTLYRFRLDGEDQLYPDPASRYQPHGCHGPSQIIDPNTYAWRDHDWSGMKIHGQVAYELHVGTFTPEGTFESARRQLQDLAKLGITLIELMPVAEFHGDFGWGYDGVQMFAPTRLYGTPDDFRRFVDTAHSLGIGVILDVVYNHFGPSGNYTGAFSANYVSRRHHTEWGEALNFDGENSAPVREYFISNAGYWIDEFHLDGLRLDATQAIYDDSADHILTVIGRQVRAAAAGRDTIIIAENEPQDVRLVEPVDDGGYELDALWNDDFHHSARVAMTGHNEFYYADFQGTPQELISAIRWGFLYQGQWNSRQNKSRGTPAWKLPAERFVTFLQNHDQVANSGHGLRMHALTSPGRLRAMSALWLLSPGTPMFFQGQEFAASAPFLYFADHEVHVAELVRKGRREFLRNFVSLHGIERAAERIDPCDPSTYERSKLDLAERDRHREVYEMHRDLLRLRREDSVFSAQRSDWIQGAVLAAEAFVLRFLTPDGDDRLLLINLGRDLNAYTAAEPMLAAPRGAQWTLLWSSEDPRYGGSGTAILDTQNWRLPGHATIVLKPAPIEALHQRETGGL